MSLAASKPKERHRIFIYKLNSCSAYLPSIKKATCRKEVVPSNGKNWNESILSSGYVNSIKTIIYR